MPYKRDIDREHPTLFVFLLDQSYSMVEPMGGNNPDNRKKKDELAAAVNAWLKEMTVLATKTEGVRHYMDVAVIGYRTDQQANPIIESAFLKPELAQKRFCSIVEIFDHTEIRQGTRSFFDDSIGEVVELTEEMPVWVDAKAEGGTPMCTALRHAYDVVDEWLKDPKHQTSFPPMVIHITDGESSEEGADPQDYANPLKEDLSTDDGKVLLLNCHLSMQQNQAILWPESDEIMPDKFARLLFNMSSALPDMMIDMANKEGVQVKPGARGMAFNADMATLVKFLQVGTRAASTLR
jgi:hypothetical protein